MPPIPLLIATAVLLVGLLVWYRGYQLHQRSAELDGLSRFRTQVQGRYPEHLVSQVYRALTEQHGARAPHHFVNLRDDLAAMHGLAALDLEDAILVAADRAGVRIPTAAELETVKDSVRTVDDLLAFLAPYFRPEVVRD